MIVLAVGAHPDDIEFMMAGTLLLLKDAGCAVHVWNLADGSCGSVELSAAEAARQRWAEAQIAAKLAGAVAHPPLFKDLGIFYDTASLARVAAVVRMIRPDIILTQSPQDYMEDHQNTVRLVVSAAFSRGMPNFSTDPSRPAADWPVALYHALPHGLEDSLRQPVQPHFYVDISAMMERKKAMLGCHLSQQNWLEVSQGMSAYVAEMQSMSARVGVMSGCFAYAEGWRRHSHLGFAAPDFDPLNQVLGGALATGPMTGVRTRTHQINPP